jgi:hypothetical protein
MTYSDHNYGDCENDLAPLRELIDPRTQRTYYMGTTDEEHIRLLELRTYAEQHAYRLSRPARDQDGIICVSMHDGPDGTEPAALPEDVWPYFWVLSNGTIASAYVNHHPPYASLDQLLTAHGAHQTTNEGTT